MLWRRPFPTVHGLCRRAMFILLAALSSSTLAGAAAAQERSISCKDPRTQVPVEIRAVRICAGAIDSTWTPDSTRLCIGSTEGVLPLAAGDGAGGAFVAWLDNHRLEPDVALQHVAADGSAASGWPDSGLVVCDAE